MLIIDDDFIHEWHPKYDRTENDEGEYQRLVRVVALEIKTIGTLSEKTFLDIWKWKGAMRVIRHVKMVQYRTLYAEAFRRAAAAPPQRKLYVLIEPNVKLPGVEAATGSTILHFMHPEIMPIIDVRTIEVLYAAGLIYSQHKDLEHYEKFRAAIEGISRRCPRCTLRQIDRALFAYHKQELSKNTRAAKCGW